MGHRPQRIDRLVAHKYMQEDPACNVVLLSLSLPYWMLGTFEIALNFFEKLTP